MDLTLSFHGGVGTVTGSRHLLSAGSTRVLVDAGLFQGLKALRLLNWRPPAFDPASVDHLLLTHTHVDHAGYLPRLLRDGYRGPVHCTPATRELARLLLLDAAKLQEEDASYANRKGFSKHRPALPLYTTQDAEAALERLHPVDYGAWLELGGGVRARFHNAGHILGSALVEVRAGAGVAETTIVFSGDVGRYDAPLHPDPAPLPPCDVAVVESTYGDRRHDARPIGEQLRGPIGETLARGGTVLIPAFAVGRAQQVTLILRRLMEAGELPEVPVHVDSPMAVDATRIYATYLRDGHLDAELVRAGRQSLLPRDIHFHRSVEESKRLNELPGPRIVVSASGMLTGGRVLHHLTRLLPDDRSLIVLVGFQPAGTRGRQLVEGRRTLRVHGRDVPVRARFVALHGLSAHADGDELVRWVRAGGARPRLAFVTHGEPDAAAGLARRLAGERGLRVAVPRLDEAFDVAALLREPTR